MTRMVIWNLRILYYFIILKGNPAWREWSFWIKIY